MAITRIDVDNFGVAEGRLVRDARLIKHADGSKSAFANLAVDRDYTDKKGQRPTDYLDFQGFISKDAKSDGAYPYMKQGNTVKITYTNQSYQKKTTAKEFVAVLKKIGVKNQAEAVLVQKAIAALGLAKFDDRHDMTEYRVNRTITGIELVRSSKANREKAQEKSEKSEKPAKTESASVNTEVEPSDDDPEDLSDADLPF